MGWDFDPARQFLSGNLRVAINRGLRNLKFLAFFIGLPAGSYDQSHIIGLPALAGLLHIGENVVQDFFC